MKAILLALISMPAFAAVDQQDVNFEQLKAACKNPGQFQNQNKPASMKLDCADRVLEWRFMGNGAFEAKNSRSVSYRLTSDKYGVPPTNGQVAQPSTNVECPTLQQFVSVVALSQDVTCADIEDFQGTAIEMCTTLLNNLRTDNAKVIESEVKPVDGKTLSFCTPKAPEAPKPAPIVKPAPVKPAPAPVKPVAPVKPEPKKPGKEKSK